MGKIESVNYVGSWFSTVTFVYTIMQLTCGVHSMLVETTYSTQPCNSFMEKDIPTEYTSKLLKYAELDLKKMKKTRKHFTFTVHTPHASRKNVEN